MQDIETLGRARKSFEQKAWADAYREFEAADREAPLDPEDLERLATAAYLIGREDESEAFRARAHQRLLERGDHEGAARSAFLLGVGLQLRGAMAPASGWFARAQHILDEAQIECVVRGYLLIPSAIQRIVQGDPAAGDALFNQAAEIARRYGDRDLACKARQGRGRALIRLGRVRGGRRAARRSDGRGDRRRSLADTGRRCLLHRAGGVSGDLRSASRVRVDDVARTMVCRSAGSRALSRRVPPLSRRSDAVRWPLA